MKKFIIFTILLSVGFYIYFTHNIVTAISIQKSEPNQENINIIDSEEKNNEEVEKESMYDLVNLTELNTNLCIELRYASQNNFTNTQVYPYSSKALLLKSTAEKLAAANEEFYQLGYRIKVLDAYRPHKYQYTLREAAYNNDPKTAGFVANPETGSHHNRGAAVDITLTDLEGRELNMPTEFDFFGPEASIYYEGCTKEQKENRELLGKVMEKHGFKRISSEWWHFDDVDCTNYPILEVDFNELY